MKQLIKKTKIVWLLIFAASFFGCEDDDDANLPEIVASFVQTINEDTGVVSFTNLSENADSYVWDFGDGTTSTEINPTKVYPTGNYTVVLTAKNTAGATNTFEDDLVINIPLPINFPVNFDDPNVNYNVSTFNGASFAIVANPDPSGSNTSTSNVGAITNIGAAFEGITLDLGMALDLTTLKSVKINFWSNTPIDVLMKLEQGTSGDVETTASHGGTGWEEIRFDFNSDASYSRITFFVDGPGTTAGTFYIDDIEQVETPAPTSGCNDVPIAATSLPLDFEGCATFPSGDNFGAGITSGLAPNPAKDGINTSDFVLKVDKPTGSDFFAGIQNTFADGFDLTTTNIFKLKVYSTKANVVFRFELLANPNDGSIGNPAPVFVTIPNANEWTEVEFEFINLPAAPTAYNQLVIKPDNDQSDSPINDGGTYYLDDLTLNADDPGNIFDDGLLTNGDFENGADSWIGNAVNVVTEGGNSFNLANVETAVPNEPFQVNLSQVVEIVQGSSYILSFDASSDRARTILAGIGLNEAPFSNVTETINLTTETQTFTLNLTATDFGLANSRVLFDMAAEVGTVVIDNVSLFLDDGGSGPSGGCNDTPIAATSLPLDFEGCETFISNFSSIGDGGVVPSLDANPSKSGINTSDNVLKVVRASGINRWGGIQNSFPAGVVDITTQVFKIKVYSSVADVTYRFELALDPQTDPVTGNPAPQFRQVSGGANEWVELEFTFTGLPASPTTYNQLVIKPDNPDGSDGELTTEERVFYFDDLRLE